MRGVFQPPGVSKHKLSVLKTRWATLKQNLEQIQFRIIGGDVDYEPLRQLSHGEAFARFVAGPSICDLNKRCTNTIFRDGITITL